MSRECQKTQLEKVKAYLEAHRKGGGVSDANSLSFVPSTSSWQRGTNSISTNSLARRIAIHLNLSVDRCRTYLEIICEDVFDEMLTGLQKWVQDSEPSEKSEGELELRKFISLMQRSDTKPIQHEAHVWALKQWMWQVKRHIMHLPVTYPVVIILYSPEEGTGKSLNAKRLYQPLNAFARMMDVDDLGERFSNQMMAQTFIVFFDELGGLDKCNAATFKSFITGRRFEGRSMRSEMGFSGENRISCLATTNIPPPHGIENESGARRLWSIPCSGILKGNPDEQIRQLDAIDHAKVWRTISYRIDSVNDLLPTEVRQYMAEVRSHTLTSHDSLDKFINEDVREDVDTGRLTPVRDVQAAHRHWARLYNQTAVKLTQKQLIERLTKRGFVCVNPHNVAHVKGLRLLTHEHPGQ